LANRDRRVRRQMSLLVRGMIRRTLEILRVNLGSGLALGDEDLGQEDKVDSAGSVDFRVETSFES
jgi:hypothetical protein